MKQEKGSSHHTVPVQTSSGIHEDGPSFAPAEKTELTLLGDTDTTHMVGVVLNYISLKAF